MNKPLLFSEVGFAQTGTLKFALVLLVTGHTYLLIFACIIITIQKHTSYPFLRNEIENECVKTFIELIRPLTDNLA